MSDTDWKKHGLAVDLQFRHHTRFNRFDPEPFALPICRVAAKAVLENRVDHDRLIDVLTDRGYKEFSETTDRIVTSVEDLAKAAATVGKTAAGSGVLNGLFFTAISVVAAPFTGGTSLVALPAAFGAGFTIGACFGTVAGLFTAAESYKQLEPDAKTTAVEELSGFIRCTYTTSQVLDYFLATDLLLTRDGGHTLYAIDVFAGCSKDSYQRKVEQVKRYDLKSAFPGKRWLGHYVLWWQGGESVSQADVENALRSLLPEPVVYRRHDTDGDDCWDIDGDPCS